MGRYGAQCPMPHAHAFDCLKVTDRQSWEARWYDGRKITEVKGNLIWHKHLCLRWC
ncbi:MAG: hypothetical protein F6J93_17120 [Oscillatoria sp. SIO1A7]|nr:hypothetical protein [Oscillatoria sp. SIO1A7]